MSSVLSVNYGVEVEIDSKVADFLIQFDQEPITEATLKKLRTWGLNLCSEVQVKRRTMNKDEVKAIGMARQAERFLVQTMYGIITPKDLML